MATQRVSLSRSLAVSIPAVWISSLLCFYLLEFRDGVLLRTLGPTWTYLLVGSAYPLIVAFPLSRLVSTRRQGRFVVAFGGLFIAAIALMAVCLRLVPGLVGGYAAGVLAVSCLGCGISYYLNRRSNFIMIGSLLACWTFLGDFTGYNTRHMLGGLEGVMAYASIYSVFLGSGLGAILWYVQRGG